MLDKHSGGHDVAKTLGNNRIRVRNWSFSKLIGVQNLNFKSFRSRPEQIETDEHTSSSLNLFSSTCFVENDLRTFQRADNWRTRLELAFRAPKRSRKSAVF